MKHRCPWCGEEVQNINGIFFIYGRKCEKCSNHYKAYTKTLIYFISAVIILVVLGFCFFIDTVYYAFYNLWGIIDLLLVNFALSLCPYEKETNNYVIQRRFKAEIEFFNSKCEKLKFPKLTVIQNQIFSICFVENEVPISHMICAATENVKWNKQDCNCILAFLPLGKLDKIYLQDTEFYVFFNGKKVGKGKLVKFLTDSATKL